MIAIGCFQSTSRSGMRTSVAYRHVCANRAQNEKNLGCLEQVWNGGQLPPKETQLPQKAFGFRLSGKLDFNAIQLP